MLKLLINFIGAALGVFLARTFITGEPFFSADALMSVFGGLLLGMFLQLYFKIMGK